MDELVNKILSASQLEEWESYDKAAKLYQEVIEAENCPPDLKRTAQKRLDHVLKVTQTPPSVLTSPVQDHSETTSDANRELIYYVDPYALELIDAIADEMPISPTEYEAIKEDIQKRGIQNPLIALPDYRLLCGYNRLKIAKELAIAKVPVIFRDIPSKDIVTFALLDNIKRRQLSSEQIVKYVGDLSILHRTGRPPRGTRRKSNKEIAKALGVSARTVTRARSYARKLRDDPTLEGKSIREVLSGEISTRKIRTYTYTIGVDELRMADDFVEIADNMFGFDIHPGDTVKLVIQAYHTKRG